MKEYQETVLWKNFKKNKPDYVNVQDIEKLCNDAIYLLKFVNVTFPNYTLHDETHSVKVMEIMGDLIEDLNELTPLENMILILSAFYHDIGLVCKREDYQNIIESEKFSAFLKKNPKMYNMVHEMKKGEDSVLVAAIQVFLRSTHHERVWDMIPSVKWNRIEINDKIATICETHGLSILETINNQKFDGDSEWLEADLRFCAIILRIADILDCTDNRAPEILYEYNKIKDQKSFDYEKTRKEWEKHRDILGFKYPPKRIDMYPLFFATQCKDIEVQKNVYEFLDMIDEELKSCNYALKFCSDRWKKFNLPGYVDRKEVKGVGFKYGEYKLTLDHEQILNLLIGENLYDDSSVFVRELIQNSLDSIRVRLSIKDDSFVPSINITGWVDQEGQYWFRIEDNGMGMSEDIILNYFLKVGSSYYNSEDFRFIKNKYRCDEGGEFTPISKFGIGLLSCFLCSEVIEVSTHHISGEKIRLSMKGPSGYYSLMREDEHHRGIDMPSPDEIKRAYRDKIGTTIVLKLNSFDFDVRGDMGRIVSKYVRCPEVPIYYNGKRIGITEREYDDTMFSFQLEHRLKNEEMKKVKKAFPILKFKSLPRVELKGMSLSEIVNNPCVKGGLIRGNVDYEIEKIEPMEILGEEFILEEEIFLIIHDHQIIIQFELRDRKEHNYDDYPLEGRFYEVLDNLYDSFELFLSENVVIDEETLKTISINKKKKFFDKKFLKKWELNESLNDVIEQLDHADKIIKMTKKEISIPSIMLYNYPWFGLFAHLYEESDYCQKIEIVYNGIIVESDETEGWFEGIRMGMILLKDSYRPEVNLARNQVINYPPDVRLELELVESKTCRFLPIRMKNACYLSSGECLKYILNSDYVDNFEKYCEIHDDGKHITIKEIKSIIFNEGQFVIKKWDPHVYDAMDCIRNALIQYYYDAEFNVDGSMVLTAKSEVGIQEELLDFLPLEFVNFSKYMGEKVCCIKLMKNIVNLNNSFITWFLKNSQDILKLYPAAHSKILYMIFHNEKITIVNEINALIRVISDGKKIHVPNDIEVKYNQIVDLR